MFSEGLLRAPCFPPARGNEANESFCEECVDRTEIVCETCQRLWAVVGTLSFYERQAMEGRPCPQCGAYTLTCEDPPPRDRSGQRPRRPALSSFRRAG
jgi:hypothetical protein